MKARIAALSQLAPAGCFARTRSTGRFPYKHAFRLFHQQQKGGSASLRTGLLQYPRTLRGGGGWGDAVACNQFAQRRLFSGVDDSYVPTTFESVVTDKYEVGDVLGVGSFGNVYMARLRGTNESYAIKAMDKERCKYAVLECELLKSVDHPNVLKFVDYFETDSHVYLVTEALEGPELFDVLVNRDRPFEEPDTLVFVEQMLLAIEACHKKDFAHLDVKIENLVFRERSLHSPLVLVDFGAAQRFVRAPYADKSEYYIEGLDDETRELTPTRPAGTIPYNSPEVLNGLFSSRSDVWSVGVSMFVLLTGRRPFESMRSNSLEAEKSVARQIKWHGGTRSRPPKPLPIPDGICSPATQHFLSRMTMGHPADRMSATEALRALRALPTFPHDRRVIAEL